MSKFFLGVVATVSVQANISPVAILKTDSS